MVGNDRLLLLTNDDGIDAPGILALREAVEGLGAWRVVAPMGPQSSCSHAVTAGRPIRVEERARDWYAVDGTPADCVRLGLHHLAGPAAWVVAGINEGGNLGADVFHSGTVAAAREAVLHGRPAIAVSHYVARGRPIDWSAAVRRTAAVLRELLERPWEPGTLWNVNLPHPEPGGPEPEVVFCPLDPSPLPLAYRIEGDRAVYAGDYHGRVRRPGADVAVCFGGHVAVTALRLVP